MCEASLGLNFPPFPEPVMKEMVCRKLHENCALCSEMKTNCSASTSFITFFCWVLSPVFVFKVGPLKDSCQSKTVFLVQSWWEKGSLFCWVQLPVSCKSSEHYQCENRNHLLHNSFRRPKSTEVNESCNELTLYLETLLPTYFMLVYLI